LFARSNELRQSLALDNPITFAIEFANIDPTPGQTRLILDITNKNPPSWPDQHIVKLLRGGGKTSSAAVAFAWLLRDDPTWRIFVQSGSFLQARRLYSYFRPLVINPELFPQEWLVGEPTQSLTLFKQGGSLEILTASAKSSRGGHVDILCIDEAVLVTQELLDAAWPVVRTSKRPKRLVLSTASPHVSLAWFLDLWQRASEKRFKRHEWPLEECHWINPADAAAEELILDSQTAIVELYGGIAQRRGLVWDNELIDGIVDPQKPHPIAVVDPRRAEEYPLPALDPLTEKWTSLDWGFIHPSVLLFYEKQGETVYIRDCRIWIETSFTQIKQEIKEDFGKYPIYPDSEAAADNADLKNMGLKVVPVVFSRDKDNLISHIRWRLEKGFLKIPNPEIDNRYFTLIQQMKAYHYDTKTGKPVKANDHCCDSLICGMKHVYHPPPKAGISTFEPGTRYQDRLDTDETRRRFLRGQGP